MGEFEKGRLGMAEPGWDDSDSPASRLVRRNGPMAAPILAVSAALERAVACSWTRRLGTML